MKENVGAWGSLDWKAVGPARCKYEHAYFDAIEYDPEIYLNAGVNFAF